MANAKTISFDVNTVDTTGDADSLPDHITFQVTQTSDQSVSVRTLIDTSQDGFGTLSSNTTQTFPMGTTPDWRLSSLKFENQKLLLLGQNGATAKSLTFDQLTSAGQSSKVAVQSQQLDKEIAENAGVIGALRDDSQLGDLGGLNADVMNGIGGLIGTKGQQMGSGGLGARGSGLGGGGTAEGLGGLGTKGRGTGSSGYGSGGGNFGVRGEGGIGAVDGDSIILGAMDKSLIDAVVQRNMAQIRYCYQRELSKNPDLAGKTTIKFVIAKDGTVSNTTVKTEDWNHSDAGKIVNSCICGRFSRFQFPEPQDGGTVMVSYPFIFSPG